MKCKQTAVNISEGQIEIIIVNYIITRDESLSAFQSPSHDTVRYDILLVRPVFRQKADIEKVFICLSGSRPEGAMPINAGELRRYRPQTISATIISATKMSYRPQKNVHIGHRPYRPHPYRPQVGNPGTTQVKSVNLCFFAH